MTDAPTIEQYHTAYLSLLQVTAEPWRSRFCQAPLAVLRDTIASMTGREPEDVQDAYEHEVRIMSATPPR